MFALRTMLSSRLLHHHFAPLSNSIFLVTFSNHVRLKHKSVGGSMYNPRSGRRESGNTHHGKTENEEQRVHYEGEQKPEESNKLLEDK